ncbi:MAG: lipocalin-like domain-containing protein [Rhizobiaceae bacterium]
MSRILATTLLVGIFAYISCYPAFSQGFSGLGTAAEGFEVPKRGTQLSFPSDHGSHPRFRIEWWYITANLTGSDGKQYGVQWTLFRSAIKPETTGDGGSWSSSQLWMGHAAITSRNTHLVSETLSRGNLELAGVTVSPFHAWINDWSFASRDQTAQTIDKMSLSATGENFSYELDLDALGPLVTHGDQGYSVKSQSGQASHYYSQPFYQVEGALHLPDGSVDVTGNAWLDREWSSQPLASQQTGWDWVSLSFADGSKLMGFRLRQEDQNYFSSGTWVSASGEPTPYSNGDLKLTPLKTVQVEGRAIPVRWRVELPDREIDVEVEALNNGAWMKTSIPYWEGPVIISGSRSGVGYLEMTGY